MNYLSWSSAIDCSTIKSRSSIQIDWWLTHFKQEYSHPKLSWNKVNKLNFRQAKKLAKKYGWKFDENV